MTSLLLAAAAAAIFSPVGTWITEDGSAQVRIEPCNQSLCGTVAKVLANEPGIPQTDVHNPNRQLRPRPLVGLPILSGFTRGGQQWTGGQIYDPKTGRTYRSKLSVATDGSLNVSGCVLFICESQRWRPAR